MNEEVTFIHPGSIPNLITNNSKNAEKQQIKQSTEFIPPSRRADAPLAAIIPPELDEIDPSSLFPDFEQGGTLRFSRLFANAKASLKEQIWWTSRTFKKKGGTTEIPKLSTEQEELAAISNLKMTSEVKNERLTTEIKEGNKEEESDEKEENEKEESIEESVEDNERATTSKSGWDFKFGNLPKKKDCLSDEYELLCAENLEELLNKNKQQQINEEDEESAPPWRFGPAQIWYDRLGVPSNPSNFDYGMKKGKIFTPIGESRTPVIDDKTFLPVNLIHWEDDIIIDGEQAKEKLIKELSSARLPRCGWIPTSHTRTYKAFMTAWKNKSFIEYLENPAKVTAQSGTSSDLKSDTRLLIDSQHSIFPFENYELCNSNWEDDIIWDSSNMPKIPKPRVLSLDYEDDPKMFGMPEDAVQDEGSDGLGSKSYSKVEGGGIKKSKLILAQVFKRQRQEEEEQIETQIAQIADKDPFNLSNDDYYMPKNTAEKTQRSLATNSGIQHSLPAQNIHPIFFPFLTSNSQLRNFHRPKLPGRFLQSLVKSGGAPILSLTRHIRMTNQRRERHISGEGGGFDIFLMREVHDLSGRDGTLLLMEYSEQFPPLLSQPGMASKIRNYYKRKPTKEQETTEYEFGETSFSHTFPFLGKLTASDSSLQVLENNMYRSAIFKHKMPLTDFLLVRTRFGFFLRHFPHLFLVGQEMPLCEVPSPNSKRAKDFSRDFMMSCIYRLFWENDKKPRRIRIDELRKIFPNQDAIIRKNLKSIAEFKRVGAGLEFWVLKDDFRLPSREEVASMITPEMYCAQASMMSAEQRLRDAGYGEKYLHVTENADDSDDQQNIGEEEIKCAPWNTTRAYIAVMKGKSFLDQTGIADPTGAGLGFSFLRVSAKPQKVAKEEVDKEAPKKLVTGTNADLRKLPLKEARQMCREFGLLEEEISQLERWDVIDVIRTLSTQAAQGKKDSQVSRFARGNARLTFADMQNKHKEHCQRIFEKQNKWLSNTEPDICDLDWESSGDELYGTQLGKRFVGAYSTTTTLNDAEQRKLEFELEERERLNLQKMIRGEVTKSGASVSDAAKEAVADKQQQKQEKSSEDDLQDIFTVPNPLSPSSGAGGTSLLSSTSGPQRKLKIYRTIKNMDGTESTRVETVIHPQLIEAYVRIRSTRDESFIKVYAQMDEKYKEVCEKRKERRRQQENARKSKKGGDLQQQQKSLISEKEKDITERMKMMTAEMPLFVEQQQQQIISTSPNKFGLNKPKKIIEKKEKLPPPPPKPSKELKITCSACGAIGHMKTNRNCPLYGKEEELASKTVGEICQPPVSRISDILDEEGCSLPSGELIEVDGTRLKISKKLYKHAEKERKNALRLHIPRKILESGVGKKFGKKGRISSSSSLSRAIPPGISKQELLASIPSTSTFIPLNEDIQLVSRRPHPLTINVPAVPPSSSALTSIGPLSAISSASSTGGGGPFSAGKRRGTLDEADYLVGPQKSVQRRRADPRVSMASLLMEILNELKGFEGSEHFAIPVNIKKVPDYLSIIKKPMDLQLIRKNVGNNQYELRQQFLSGKRTVFLKLILFLDLTQIIINSSTYNGPNHPITEAARKMVQYATKKLEENDQRLIELEKQINPLLDDDDIVGFSYILLQIVQECKNLPKSVAFHSRVDSKKEQNAKEHRYTTIEGFRKDFEQIVENSRLFNGPQSVFTLKAEEILSTCNQLLEKSREPLTELEFNIQKALKFRVPSLIEEDNKSIFTNSPPSWQTINEINTRNVQINENIQEEEIKKEDSSPPKFYVGDDEDNNDDDEIANLDLSDSDEEISEKKLRLE
uniref:Bromo domain-containing protein n=1 Tax=Meloidogyne hapla TaxID=6305 RepID=A0A1I8BD87_MELHA